MWTVKMPVLSTAHLKPETIVWLENQGAKICYAPYDAGGFLFVGAGYFHDPPQELQTVVDWAVKTECEWLRFDTAGDTIPDLPIYDWR